MKLTKDKFKEKFYEKMEKNKTYSYSQRYEKIMDTLLDFEPSLENPEWFKEFVGW